MKRTFSFSITLSRAYFVQTGPRIELGFRSKDRVEENKKTELDQTSVLK